MRVEIIESVVVFPAPFGPSRPNISPSLISKEMPRTTSRPSCSRRRSRSATAVETGRTSGRACSASGFGKAAGFSGCSAIRSVGALESSAQNFSLHWGVSTTLIGPGSKNSFDPRTNIKRCHPRCSESTSGVPGEGARRGFIWASLTRGCVAKHPGFLHLNTSHSLPPGDHRPGRAPDMSEKAKAVVVGVGPEAGLGGALCERFAREGLHVFVAGRTPAKVEALVATLRNAGGRATGVTTDTTI